MVRESLAIIFSKYATIKQFHHPKDLLTCIDAISYDDRMARPATKKNDHMIAVMDVVPLMPTMVTMCEC
eukprot:9017715-Ditylum_brightwellii.AAC.1